MDKKTIVLLDFYNGGHREAFMQFFAKALIESGHTIICVMPDTGIIQSWLQERDLNYNTHFFNCSSKEKEQTIFGRFNFAISRAHLWYQQRKIMQQIERQLKINIDLVYFNWMDSLMANYLPATLVDIIFPYKWSGLYFHPVIFRQHPEFLNFKATFRDVDAVFLAKNCVGITMHDEGMLEKFRQRIKKPVFLFPEIADSTPPNPQHILAERIREKAKGRTIVGIIGLEPYKGVLPLVRIAKIADPNLFFFAFTGVYKPQMLENLSVLEKEEIINFSEDVPENCIWQTGSLQEGEDYNSVFCSFDIIYIVYRNFYSSSNRLTKASIFHRLVLASNNGCVGEDVPSYNLGAVADENNIEEQLSKLDELRIRLQTDELPLQNWTIYANKHHTDRLPEKFDALLQLLL